MICVAGCSFDCNYSPIEPFDTRIERVKILPLYLLAADNCFVDMFSSKKRLTLLINANANVRLTADRCVV